MSKMKTYVTNRTYLNAEQIADKEYIIHLSNGKKIEIVEAPEYNGGTWLWKVEDQYFGKDEYALNYLKRLINEKLTGIRIIYHKKWDVPEICGIDGRACRCPGKCNTMLCEGCPVAEAFFAERDGVKLIYAV